MTLDKLWIIYRPAKAGRTRKSTHPEGIVYALGETREGAWHNAALVMSSPEELVPETIAYLRRQGYRGKRCTLLVEVPR